jgi:REP element-mobilizing transposase RayT
MTDYRRNFLAGGSFFFTVNLAERRLRLLTDHINPVKHRLVRGSEIGRIRRSIAW